MLQIDETCCFDSATHDAHDVRCQSGLSCVRARALDRGDVLFQAGNIRTHAYRVEAGAICHYIVWPDGHHDIIEFAFPGDIVGLGHGENHVSTAQAMVESAVSIVAPHDLASALRTDDQLGVRLAAAADREFDYLKARALAQIPQKPARRVAAVLYALGAINQGEGRTAHVACHEVISGVVADRLALTDFELQAALQELSDNGFLTVEGGEFEINDLAALEKFSAAA